MSWKDTSVTGYPEFTRTQGRGCDQTVSADADGITTEERMSGYEGWTATVHVPLDVLRQLLAKAGLHIVTEADKRVLEASAAMALCDDDPDACEAEPLEPQEHGEDCYIYTDDQYAIAKAELARRTP